MKLELLWAILAAVINAGLLGMVTMKLLHIMQLGGYKNLPFACWAYNRRGPFLHKLLAIAFLGFGCSTGIDYLLYVSCGFYLPPAGLVPYFILLGILASYVLREKPKVAFRVTPRIKRLWFASLVFMFLTSLGLALLGASALKNTPLEPVRYALVAAGVLLLPLVLIITNVLLWPLEAVIRASWLRKANKKLARPEYSDLIKIGITGSYGKTSCKNILTTLLREKYKVCASPSSYNTPMGFARTVNETLQNGDRVLVFEMGARRAGDIKTLARLMQPKYGILTAVGAQHIATFKTLENIRHEKSELIKSLPADGAGVVCGDLYDELKDSQCKVLPPPAFEVTKTGETGCEFKLTLAGKTIQCKTKLLGEHNVHNIALCAALAAELGISPEKIKTAIGKLEPTPHRLQFIKADNGITILDDSYNASPAGARAALDVLKLFKGKKVVVTPGFVELGANSHRENYELGKNLAATADAVILVNELNKAALTEGLASENYAPEKIHHARTLDEAKEIYKNLLEIGDTLLLLNDLPDNFR